MGVRSLVAGLLVLYALSTSASAAARDAATLGAVTQLKTHHSNPVLPVTIEGKTVNLILTTDIDGILVCADPPDSVTAPSANRIDFDYARKLVRYMVTNVIQQWVSVRISIPSLDIDARMPVGVFYMRQQALSPTALAYFLYESRATGFIGVGYAFRLANSPFWSLLKPALQYRYALSNTSTDDHNNTAALALSDYVSGQLESEQTEWDWTEPSASVDQADDLTRNNDQGLVFPIHHAQFGCVDPMAGKTHRVNIFGDFTSNWDVVVDVNSPCLVLPQQFYNSLVGWIGIAYDEETKLSTVRRDIPMPSLRFSLTHDGPAHQLDLDTLILNATNTSSSSEIKWLCLQRGASIVHNGASVFAPIETGTSSVQRYRLHGSMVLPVYNMQQTPIVLGLMALRALNEMIVDGESKQMAFPHPSTVSSSPKGLPACLPTPQCIGQQLYDERLNTCLDPDCSAYYFQSLDADTKQCRVDDDYLTFVFTAVAVFIAAELLVSSSLSRSVQAASASAVSH